MNGQRGVDTATVKVEPANDGGTVLSEGIRLLACKLEGKARTREKPRGQPDARRNLILEARPDGVALILRVGEVAAELAERGANVVAEEEPASNRKPDIADHVRVAEEGAKLASTTLLIGAMVSWRVHFTGIADLISNVFEMEEKPCFSMFNL